MLLEKKYKFSYFIFILFFSKIDILFYFILKYFKIYFYFIFFSNSVPGFYSIIFLQFSNVKIFTILQSFFFFSYIHENQKDQGSGVDPVPPLRFKT